MHGSSLVRMEWFVTTYLPGDRKLKVLDVGSMDVAGGSYRRFFLDSRFDYHGLDLEPGPNVHITPRLPYHWPELAESSYDVIISGQAFEHMEFFWLAAAEMARVLRPEGLLCIIAPRGFARHRHPVDCYRFDSDGMLAIARYCNLEPLHVSCDMRPPEADDAWHIDSCEDALLVARKPQNWSGIVRASSYQFLPEDMESLAGNFAPCPPTPKMPMIPRWEYDKLRDQTRAKLGTLECQLRQREEEIAALHRIITGYEKSRSWRITRPLRAVTQALRRLRRRA